MTGARTPDPEQTIPDEHPAPQRAWASGARIGAPTLIPVKVCHTHEPETGGVIQDQLELVQVTPTSIGLFRNKCRIRQLPEIYTTGSRATHGALRSRREIHEAREVAVESDGERVGRTVAVLGDDEIRLALARAVLFVCALAVQQDHHVGILLERS